jgi:hypothetical protein
VGGPKGDSRGEVFMCCKGVKAVKARQNMEHGTQNMEQDSAHGSGAERLGAMTGMGSRRRVHPPKTRLR